MRKNGIEAVVLGAFASCRLTRDRVEAFPLTMNNPCYGLCDKDYPAFQLELRFPYAAIITWPSTLSELLC
jgi:hypothetical protein